MKNISEGYRSPWWAWFIEKFLKRDKIWLLLKNRKNGKHHVRQLPLFVWHSEVKCPSSKFSNFFYHIHGVFIKRLFKEVFWIQFWLNTALFDLAAVFRKFLHGLTRGGNKFWKGVFFVVKCFNFGSVCAEIRTTISQN